MPPFLAALALKGGELALSLAMQYVFPRLIGWLRETGHINAAEEMMGKGALAVAKEMKTIKCEPNYPTQDTRGQR